MSCCFIKSDFGVMTPPFTIADWDSGRLQVNTAFADILQRNGLTTFESLMRYTGGEVAKHLIAERPTTRIELQGSHGPVVCFLKRHAPAKLKEYLKPLIRLRWPRIGARPEWEAIREFQAVEIPTMTPVAWGCRGRESLLVTLAIDGCEKLSDWMKRTPRPTTPQQVAAVRRVIREVAEVTRKMHGAGMHHQDLYAGHILLPHDTSRGIHLLDLGRVRRCRRLGTIWIVKDLAQLHYSTDWFTASDRLRFLQIYLGRPLGTADRSLIRRILSKAASIDKHSRKRGYR
ncbi:MAG: lipopolysaccharide kinase [Planctomycetaceae bacterium]|nr:lipopolysaccharide kinase [Planctomycetaceae bacterium]